MQAGMVVQTGAVRFAPCQSPLPPDGFARPVALHSCRAHDRDTFEQAGASRDRAIDLGRSERASALGSGLLYMYGLGSAAE